MPCHVEMWATVAEDDVRKEKDNRS